MATTHRNRRPAHTATASHVALHDRIKSQNKLEFESVPPITHGSIALSDLRIPVLSDKERSTRASRRSATIKVGSKIDARTTPRFWNSLLARYALSDNVFQYFQPSEVLQRVIDRRGDERVQYTMAGNELLAITAPNTQWVDHGELVQAAKEGDATHFRYIGDGNVEMRFIPNSGDRIQKIGGDEFQNFVNMTVPLDGYGKPTISLATLRLICSNGAVGMAKVFQQVINSGKEPMRDIRRALSSYDDPEGFSLMRERIAAAQKSWASVKETETLRQIMLRHDQSSEYVRSGSFDKFTGSLTSTYGIAGGASLSAKRQAVLPTKVRVYDLVNYASEMATHHIVDAREQLAYHGFIGNLLANEYDLEGSASKVTDFADFLIGADDNKRSVDTVALDLATAH